MIGMDSKNVMTGKVIIIVPGKKPGIVDVKNPKRIRPLFVAPQIGNIKPTNNTNEIQKSIICFA